MTDAPGLFRDLCDALQRGCRPDRGQPDLILYCFGFCGMPMTAALVPMDAEPNNFEDFSEEFGRRELSETDSWVGCLMWLVYGVDTDHALVFISDVPRGKTRLRCPYCAGPLTAKKGRLVGHHFAHTGETCREVAEVHQQLRAHFTTVIISVLGTWPHRGNVELYFKHRYHGFQRPIGSLTEYFAFSDRAAVLRDLRRMQPKELTPAEYDVLDGKPAPIEQRIAAAERQERHKQAIRDGMLDAARKGTHIGRPTGEETPAAFLAKPASQLIIGALDVGLSVRAAARQAGVAINTVRKVAALREQRGAEGKR